MERRNVLVIGGGLSGLLAAYVLRRRVSSLAIVEATKTLGGDFLAGGLRYVHHTRNMEALLKRLKLPYSSYAVRGGLLLEGAVRPYPRCFEEMSPDRADRIRRDHYRKTRGLEPGGELAKAMNDPANNKPRRALKCCLRDLVSGLARGQEVIRGSVTRATEKWVELKSGARYGYDWLVYTIPLWCIKGLVDYPVPEALARRLNVVKIAPKVDAYARWDYVYTPYTPHNHIHRISPDGGHYAVECNGRLNQADFVSDLNFLFADGWSLVSLRQDLKGHLLPLEQRVTWPVNTAALGRYATWDPRATADVTLDKAKALAKKWFPDG